MKCQQCKENKCQEDFRGKRKICRICEATKSREYYAKKKDIINKKQQIKRLEVSEQKNKALGITEDTKKCNGCNKKLRKRLNLVRGGPNAKFVSIRKIN